MTPNGTDSPSSAVRGDREVDRPLQHAVEAAQRHVVEADDRDAVEVLEPGAQRDELEQVGDDVHLDALAVGRFDDAEHLDVLFERQRHVDVIDPFLPDDLVRLAERAEQRQAAVADVIAGGPVVQEADHLEAELAVLEDLVGDQLAEIARARDQHPLQADAGLPPLFERLADDLARAVRERDVDRHEQRPAELGDLVDALVLQFLGQPVRLEIQRAEQAQDDRQNGADEHREEVVHARPPAAQPVEALHVERRRHDQADERQHVEVLREGGDAFGRGNDGRQDVEAKNVGEDERRHGQHRVAHDVEGDQQAVVPPHHGWASLSAMASDTAVRKSVMNRSRENRSALARMAAGSNDSARTRASPSAKPAGDPSFTSTPVTPSTTVSHAPPSLRATTGVPHA